MKAPSMAGRHFHLLCRMHLGKDYTDEDIRQRYKAFFEGEDDMKDRELTDYQVERFREKWADLSEFIKDLKQGFSRFYNKRHNRRGFFWSERFKSVIVDNGDTLINCLAYIDLNPVRAEMVDKPEEYVLQAVSKQLGSQFGAASHNDDCRIRERAGCETAGLVFDRVSCSTEQRRRIPLS